MKNFTIIILAGGFGKRLGIIGEAMPKSLIPIDKKPFIDYQLNLLTKNGFDDIIMCLGYKQGMIVNHLKLYWPNVKYVLDTEYLGTGGSIRAALPLIEDDNFFVTYGDSYLQTNYQDIQNKFIKSNKDGLMVIYKNKNKKDKSNVEYNNSKIIKYDKENRNSNMEYIDYGVSIFNKKCFTDGKYDLSEIHKNLLAHDNLECYVELKTFYEIGSLDGINNFEEYIKTKGENSVVDNHFVNTYLGEVIMIAKEIDQQSIQNIAEILVMLRERNGRLFILGNGGSQATAEHAVNDFRKICGIKAFCSGDNVAELTARVNDEGWDNAYADWLKAMGLDKNDCLLVLSVGGGSRLSNISSNIVNALKLGEKSGCDIIGVTGRDGGYTASIADAIVIIPTVEDSRITPHTEGFTSVVLHLLVSHPLLQSNKTKWESVLQ